MAIVLLGVVISAAMQSCAYNKKEVLAPPCATPNTVSYGKDVVPILQANCYYCHSTGANSSGILLDNYNGLKFYAGNGFLYGTIAHLSGYRPMPIGSGKLSDCDIAVIKKWIDAGAPQ